MSKEVKNYSKADKIRIRNESLANRERRNALTKKSLDSFERKQKINKSFGIIGILLLILIAISLFKSLYSNNSLPISFSSFLSSLSNYHAYIDVASIMDSVNLQILEEWSILDGLRVFLNNILGVFEVVIYIVLCIASLFEFIFWVITNLFFS